MNEEVVNKVLLFIQKCEKKFLDNIFLEEDSIEAQEYIHVLEQIKKENDSTMINATIKKLDLIIKQIHTVNYHNNHIENSLNLVSLSVTEFIISLVKEKHLVDPLLIARYAYIELAKVLYYNISYVKQTDSLIKNKICNATVNVEKEKMNSETLINQ